MNHIWSSANYLLQERAYKRALSELTPESYLNSQFISSAALDERDLHSCRSAVGIYLALHAKPLRKSEPL